MTASLNNQLKNEHQRGIHSVSPVKCKEFNAETDRDYVISCLSQLAQFIIPHNNATLFKKKVLRNERGKV
jgi:hypothetical protein